MTHLSRMRVNTCTQVYTKLTLVLSRKVLSLTKPKGIKRNPSAIILQYDSTWDWTQVSQAIGEHSDHYVNAWLIVVPFK